jgi:hypothetical protein
MQAPGVHEASAVLHLRNTADDFSTNHLDLLLEGLVMKLLSPAATITQVGGQGRCGPAWTHNTLHPCQPHNTPSAATAAPAAQST